jgi:hypothetical protein
VSALAAITAITAITASVFNNYDDAAATIAALVSAKFNNISTATKGNQQYNTVHFTYSMKTRNHLTPSTDSEQTHSGPAKRLNSRTFPFHQVTKQPTRINFPAVEFQHSLPDKATDVSLHRLLIGDWAKKGLFR